jgi:hypothetical protein
MGEATWILAKVITLILLALAVWSLLRYMDLDWRMPTVLVRDDAA